MKYSSILRMGLRSIEKISSAEIKTRKGVITRVALGGSHKARHDPFLVMDNFSLDGTGGFPQHPHKGQETITYVIDGAFAHEDFTGSRGILYPGDSQFMTAGRGIVHSEMPDNEKGVYGVQLWLDLPNKLKNVEARYQDLKEWETPEIITQEGKLKVRIISGKSYGVELIKNLAYTPIELYHFQAEPGASFKQELKDDFNYFAYVLDGGIEINNKKAKKLDSIFFNRDGDLIEGKNNNSEKASFLIIGGQVHDQKSIQYGPFVAESESKIEQAFSDFQTDTNGFENKKTWKPLLQDGKITKSIVDNQLGGNLEKRAAARAKWLKENGHDEKGWVVVQ